MRMENSPGPVEVPSVTPEAAASAAAGEVAAATVIAKVAGASDEVASSPPAAAPPAEGTSPPLVPEVKLDGKELLVALKKQVEFYFSKQNLQSDGFLVSKMNAQMCVPVAVIAQFHKIQQLTSDTALIVESVKDSTVCTVTPDGIKPSIKQERNTIILREIPSETPQEKIREIFTGDGVAPIKSIRSDVGDTWFVTMESEDDALTTILSLRGKTFEGKAIKARLKSENLLRSFFPVPTAAEVQPTAAAAAAAPYGLGAAAGPAGAGMPGGIPYGMMNGMGAPMMNGQPNYGYSGPGARGGMYGRGGMMMQQQQPGGAGGGGAGGMRFGGGMQQQQHVGMVQGGGGGGRGGGMMAGARGGMQMGGMGGGMHQGQQHGMGQQMMGMNANHPQQAPAPAPAAGGLGYPGAFIQYQPDDILKIVSTLSQSDVAVVPGVADIREHSLAFEADANLGLMMRQRSVSIDECREQLRKGRPVHREGVIAGAVDYGTYMYGEGHDPQQQAGSAPRGEGYGEGGAAGESKKKSERSRREKGANRPSSDDSKARGGEEKPGRADPAAATAGAKSKDASKDSGAAGGKGKGSGTATAAAGGGAGEGAPPRPTRGWEKPEVTQQKQRGLSAGSDAGNRGGKATSAKSAGSSAGTDKKSVSAATAPISGDDSVGDSAAAAAASFTAEGSSEGGGVFDGGSGSGRHPTSSDSKVAKAKEGLASGGTDAVAPAAGHGEDAAKAPEDGKAAAAATAAATAPPAASQWGGKKSFLDVVKAPGNLPLPIAAAPSATKQPPSSSSMMGNKAKGGGRIKSPLRGRPEPPSGESRDMKRSGGRGDRDGHRGDGHHHKGSMGAAGGGGKDSARLPNGRSGSGGSREKGAWA
ncbi:unnamed protein product [Ectocarpus sp. 4 AP-2014]